MIKYKIVSRSWERNRVTEFCSYRFLFDIEIDVVNFIFKDFRYNELVNTYKIVSILNKYFNPFAAKPQINKVFHIAKYIFSVIVYQDPVIS